MNRPAYPSDLSDDEWELLKPLIGSELAKLSVRVEGSY